MNKNIKHLNLLLAHDELRQANDFVLNLRNSKQEPDYILDHYQGIICLKEKKFSDSIFFFKQALLKKSDFFESILNLGVAHLSNNEFEPAKRNFVQAQKIKPDFIDNYIFLAKVYFAEKNDQKGFDVLNDALSKFPNNSKLAFEIGKTYIEKKEFKSGELILTKYLKNNPKDYFAHNNLGICEEGCHQYDKSIISFKNSLRLNPNFIYALLNLGNALRGVGEVDEAIKCFKKIIQLDKYNIEVHRYLSIIYKYKSLDDEHLIQMLGIIEENIFKNKNNNEKSQMYFAIFKAYEDLKDNEKAFKFLLLANQIYREGISYSEKLIKDHFEMMKKIFNPSFVAKHIQYGSSSKKPIFIIGMPRSGTTLVEQIISSHSQVDSGGELFFLQKYIKKYIPETNCDVFVKKTINEAKEIIPKIASKYLEEINSLSNNLYCTDKLPFNFLFFGFIRVTFPEAKIIICKRSAKDVCLSIFKNYFPMEHAFAYDQVELANYYNFYANLISYWKENFPDNFYEIEYEKLVSNQVEESKKLIAYCNLNWEENCLHFYKNKSSVNTLSTAQVRQSMYNVSVAGWKKYEPILSTMFKLLSD